DIRLHHLIRIGLAGHLAHHLDDEIEALGPGKAGEGNVGRRVHVRSCYAREMEGMQFEQKTQRFPFMHRGRRGSVLAVFCAISRYWSCRMGINSLFASNVNQPAVETLESRRFLSADVVLEWNQHVIETVRADRTSPGPTWASRNFAIVQ